MKNVFCVLSVLVVASISGAAQAEIRNGKKVNGRVTFGYEHTRNNRDFKGTGGKVSASGSIEDGVSRVVISADGGSVGGRKFGGSAVNIEILQGNAVGFDAGLAFGTDTQKTKLEIGNFGPRVEVGGFKGSIHAGVGVLAAEWLPEGQYAGGFSLPVVLQLSQNMGDAIRLGLEAKVNPLLQSKDGKDGIDGHLLEGKAAIDVLVGQNGVIGVSAQVERLKALKDDGEGVKSTFKQQSATIGAHAGFDFH